ncbi:MAG: TylF/MycF/NovP-related O-methyltransferase [Tepidisphaeraceae bacterium]
MPTTTEEPTEVRELYLSLLKASLTDTIHPHEFARIDARNRGLIRRLEKTGLAVLKSIVSRKGLDIVRSVPYDPSRRQVGQDWPVSADTMIGLKRLNQVQAAIEDIVRNDVPGDLIECGVWRGGSTILMRAVLKTLGDTKRTVWAADSFEGLPPPDPSQFPADANDPHHQFRNLMVGLEQVKANFRRYNLLDDRVQFLKGWFKDTLPTAPVQQLSLLRADGDMYESTYQIFENLYPKLSVGGYCIVDDYGGLEGCRKAVDDYRAKFNITEPIQQIDWTGIFWKRER